ncbi:ATP-binding cassette domain-containing protein [Rhizobium ruizarguesonis]|nr:ATP-binding cassette domain-containing protein [Rhizobium ruizarguesonis]
MESCWRWGRRKRCLPTRTCVAPIWGILMAAISSVVVKNLAVERGGKRVIHDVSFAIKSGEITALLGANGAGKSSTVMALAGVLPIAGGRMRLDATSLTGLSPDRIRRAGLALVPEGHRVLGQLSVEDNILVAAFDGSPSARREGLERAYEIFPELAQRKRQLASDLSGARSRWSRWRRRLSPSQASWWSMSFRLGWRRLWSSGWRKH